VGRREAGGSLTSAAGVRPRRLPVGGEEAPGLNALPVQPPVEELAQPTIAEVAAAEATADDWAARATELRAELDAESDRARSGLLAYELGELTDRRLHDQASRRKTYAPPPHA